jgi:hypothetical protein
VAAGVSRQDRNVVAERAGFRCEYCLLHQDDSFQAHEVDHITSLKHGGDSSIGNLAYACAKCNAWKGSDVAGYNANGTVLSPLFHPRRDAWEAHFELLDGEIAALTPVGEVTVRLLKFNTAGRISERILLIAAGRYPGTRRPPGP